jgi:hypothetical protein
MTVGRGSELLGFLIGRATELSQPINYDFERQRVIDNQRTEALKKAFIKEKNIYHDRQPHVIINRMGLPRRKEK